MRWLFMIFHMGLAHSFLDRILGCFCYKSLLSIKVSFKSTYILYFLNQSMFSCGKTFDRCILFVKFSYKCLHFTCIIYIINKCNILNKSFYHLEPFHSKIVFFQQMFDSLVCFMKLRLQNKNTNILGKFYILLEIK